MRSYRPYRHANSLVKQRRPAGISLFAFLGVLVSGAVLALALLGLWTVMRETVALNRQFIAFGVAALLALLVLRVNWALWELVKWAWLANVLVTGLNAALLVFALGRSDAVGELLGRIVPALTQRDPARLAFLAMVAMLVYHALVGLYMFTVMADFKVGVKDERPLWEKVHRN